MAGRYVCRQAVSTYLEPDFSLRRANTMPFTPQNKTEHEGKKSGYTAKGRKH